MGRRPYKGRDRYADRARKGGYEARSVFKLEAIARKAPILRKGARVVDLGCFPGSWTRYALERVGPTGVVVGVDFDAPRVSGATFLEASALDVPPERLLDALGGPADTVLSDMAPRTTGDRVGDHLRQIALAERALHLATQVLRPGGAFVCKVFEGGEAQAFVEEARRHFTAVRRVRPDAVRKVSREWFLLATGLRAP